MWDKIWWQGPKLLICVIRHEPFSNRRNFYNNIAYNLNQQETAIFGKCCLGLDKYFRRNRRGYMKRTFAVVAMTILVCFALTGCDTKAPKLSGLKDKYEVQCGSDLNLNTFIADKLLISDVTEDGTVDYKFNELEHSIKCEGDIFNLETGEVNTDVFGTFRVDVTVKDKANNASTKSFNLTLNPIEVKKDFYTYKQSFSENYDLLGFCGIENRSKEPLKINKITFTYLDKDGITICESEMTDFAPQFINGHRYGFAKDDFAGTTASIKSPDDIKTMNVDVDYGRATMEDNTTLDVGKITRLNDYPYNVSRFAGETVVANPYSKKVESYMLLVGMFDKNDRLIGVMDSMMNSTSIGADSKAKSIAGWLPDSTERPKLTDHMRGAAYAIEFAQ